MNHSVNVVSFVSLGKKRQIRLDVFAASFIVSGKKLTCSEHPGLWHIFGITHIISGCMCFLQTKRSVDKIENKTEYHSVQDARKTN